MALRARPKPLPMAIDMEGAGFCGPRGAARDLELVYVLGGGWGLPLALLLQSQSPPGHLHAHCHWQGSIGSSIIRFQTGPKALKGP